jgi:hypothetical protein
VILSSTTATMADEKRAVSVDSSNQAGAHHKEAIAGNSHAVAERGTAATDQ